MTRYLTRRVLLIPVALFYITLLTFIATRLSGDPTVLMLPPDATLEDIQAYRERIGLEEPIHVQYGRFLSGILQGDFGRSLHFRQDSLALVLSRLPATAELTLAAMALAVPIGVGAGVLSATKSGSLLDDITSVFVLLGQSIPVFWLGLMMILFFSVRLGVFPVYGRGGPEHLVLPAVTLAAYSTARIARLTRSSVVEVLREDYVRTARAKGLTERRVMAVHVMKNSAIPVVTVIGLQIGAMFAGAVVTETVFAWPGLGMLITQAVFTRDYPVIVAAVFVSSLIFMVAALLVDISYLFFNPRLRYE
jgi:peptide/nickel transport system permease protein